MFPFATPCKARGFQSKQSKERLDLVGNLIQALKTDTIDLVILNTSPLSLKARVVQNKEILVDKFLSLHHSFESLVLHQ